MNKSGEKDRKSCSSFSIFLILYTKYNTSVKHESIRRGSDSNKLHYHQHHLFIIVQLNSLLKIRPEKLTQLKRNFPLYSQSENWKKRKRV